MGKRKQKSLMTQMLVGQAFLVLINGLILVVTALAISPSIFNRHLDDAGVTSVAAQTHVTEAYISSFNLSLGIAAIISLVLSGVLAWFFMLRIVQPIESVTSFAETLAGGDADAQTPLDISIPELARLAKALEEMSVDLAKSREEQGRLLSDLAHELRTPIATVSAIVDGIEDGVVIPQAQTWQTIRDQLERVNRLSRDVREVSQNSGTVMNTMTSLVAADTLANAAHSAWAARIEGKGIAFKLELASSLPLIEVDPQRIGQVLSNLLENALRYTPTGGSIILSTGSANHEVYFSIRDSGEGIPAHQIPFVFNRLFRGDPARHSGDSGSGLGLTIAKSIAENHGGTVTAMSHGADQGSVFTLYLPTNFG